MFNNSPLEIQGKRAIKAVSAKDVVKLQKVLY